MTISTVDERLAELDAEFDAATDQIELLQRKQEEILAKMDNVARGRWADEGVLLNRTAVGVEGYDEDFVIVDVLGPYWVMVSSVQTDQILQVPATSIRVKG